MGLVSSLREGLSSSAVAGEYGHGGGARGEIEVEWASRPGLEIKQVFGFWSTTSGVGAILGYGVIGVMRLLI